MTIKKARPLFLNLLQIRMPPGAIISFGHRISGLLLVFAGPLLLYLLDLSLQSPQGFEQVAEMFEGVVPRVLLVLLGWLFFHHLLGGVRYLGIDVGLGVSRGAARRSAWMVAAGGLLLGVLVGVAL